MTWAAKQKLPSAQKLVLMMLANRCNADTGQCNPSHDRLADDCGMGKSTLKNHIRILADHGLLTIQHRKLGDVSLPNQYLLHLDVFVTLGRGGSKSAPPVGQNLTDVGQNLAEGGSESGYKPVKETVKETGSQNLCVQPSVAAKTGTLEQPTGEQGEDLSSPVITEETMATVNEVLAKMKGKPVQAKGFNGLVILWKKHMAVITEGFVKELTAKDRGQLKQFQKAVGDDDLAMAALDFAMRDWAGFTWYVSQQTGQSGGPAQPVIGYLLMHYAHLLHLSAKEKAKASAPLKVANAPVAPKVFDKPHPITENPEVGMESDTEPEFSSAADALAYAKALQQQKQK